MNNPLFMRIVGQLSNEVEFFRQKKDALGRLSLSPFQKCTAAIRILAYGIISLFGDEYLRRPTPDDLQRLLHAGEFRGFSGMIGSIDCMHWEWKNCPTAWKGQYARDTLNDINVLDRSPVFDDIIQSKAPQVTYSVNGREYHLAYYLTDEFQQGEDTESSHVDVDVEIDIPSNITNMMGARSRIHDPHKHQQLKANLVEHIWHKFGEF
uniref:Uncharacterized protein n=1 Tax=Brassica oleracea var. oleracea TaxID=109376 RepID=A0A0D3ABL9_BRAOL